MFDGDRRCNICDKEVEGGRKSFSMNLSGHTYVFCDHCHKNRKRDIERLLNEDE